MSLRSSVSSFVRSLLGFDDLSKNVAALTVQNTALNMQNTALLEKIDLIEKRLVENTRAVATLALVQANLMKEIGDIANNFAEKESRSSKSYVRKTGTDFTN